MCARRWSACFYPALVLWLDQRHVLKAFRAFVGDEEGHLFSPVSLLPKIRSRMGFLRIKNPCGAKLFISSSDRIVVLLNPFHGFEQLTKIGPVKWSV